MFRTHAVLAVLLLCLTTGPAWAHKLAARCSLSDGHLEIIVSYDTGAAARNAQVRILSAENKELHKGNADRKGRWKVLAPLPGKYLVRVTDGAGHVARTTFTLKENKLDQSPVESKHTESSNSAPKKLILETPRADDGFVSSLWVKAGIGVGAIALVCLALLVAVSVQKKRPEGGSIP